MKRFISGILSFIIALSILGCQNENSSNSDISVDLSSIIESSVDDIFDLYNYENDEVFYIDEMEVVSKCRTYEFSFLSDGYQIKAYIAIPIESIESQQPCKCILYNRGGHYDFGKLDYEYLSLLCAYTGRIIVACEIRGDNGSEGYDQFGGDELHDVFKLIDLCENRFTFVDMDDFCVAGESRGGMMTYMAARQDKRIKKILVASSVCDIFKAYEEREDMQQTFRDCIGGTPEELPEEYEKRSALYWADEINIPVMLVHSKGDKQANFDTQAQTMYDKLKDSTDCTFIVHDDDYHGLRKDDIAPIVKWLENK